MLTRFLGHLAVAASLAVAACSVQLVSPYNAEIASGLVSLNTSILATTTDVARNAQNPQTRAKAAFENYAKTYDAWLAQVETMRILSDIGNPGALDCASVAKRLGSLPGLPPTDLSDLQGSRRRPGDRLPDLAARTAEAAHRAARRVPQAVLRPDQFHHPRRLRGRLRGQGRRDPRQR